MNAPHCSHCGKPCKIISVDFGSGPYEYFGTKGVDIDIQDVSECCEAPVTEGPPEPEEVT